MQRVPEEVLTTRADSQAPWQYSAEWVLQDVVHNWPLIPDDMRGRQQKVTEL